MINRPSPYIGRESEREMQILVLVHMQPGLPKRLRRINSRKIPCGDLLIPLRLFFRLRNSDGWRDVLGRLFRTRSVMGRLWDDHFRDLGHPPKFYRVQDAGFIGGSSIWWQISPIFKKNHWTIIINHVFSPKWHNNKKNGRDAGHRSPEWGCTKTTTFNKNLRRFKNIRKSTPDQP